MKNRGKVWIITGLLLIAAALSLTVYNLADEAHANQAANDMISELLEEVIEAQKSGNGRITMPVLPDEYGRIPEMPVKVIDGKEYIAIISIPSLELDLPVFSTWDYTKLRSAPCHFSGSVYTDDFVVCAHNYSRHFGQIKNLSIGDAVTVIDMAGNVFNYTVIGLETLNPTAVDDMIEADDWDLTLFTCTLSGATRVTVRCARIE